MNQKGQAYSVFKLLIAAIVAMAILGILVPIIMQVMGIITKNPTDETKTLISNLVNNPGTLQHTDPVTFKPNTALSADSLTAKTSLSPEQICFSLGEFEYDVEGDFSLIPVGAPNKILYSGAQDRTVKIAVVCARGTTKLTTEISDYGLTANIETCGCGASQTCCAVILEPS